MDTGSKVSITPRDNYRFGSRRGEMTLTFNVVVQRYLTALSFNPYGLELQSLPVVTSPTTSYRLCGKQTALNVFPKIIQSNQTVQLRTYQASSWARSSRVT